MAHLITRQVLSQLAFRFNIDFQDGGHLEFPIKIILATFRSTSHLDTSNEVLSQMAFLLEEKVQSWISDQNNFSYF